MKITGSLVVCSVAAAFTATALLVNPAPITRRPAVIEAGAPPQITIAQFAFSATTVAPGATLTVSNLDADDHTVTSTDGSFDSGVVVAGAAIGLVAPATPGVYAFVCVIHPSMSGELTVQAPQQV